MEDIITGLRSRHVSAPNLSTTADYQTSKESNETLTPTSSDDREETQAHPTEAPASAAWRQLATKVLGLPHFPATAEANPDTDEKGGFMRVEHKKLEDHVDGTPRFAALLNSNDSFCIFRRFGDEAARLLLRREIELCQLATKLDELNKTDREGLLKWRLTTFDRDDDCTPAQSELMDKMEMKLLAYYDFLLKYTDVRALPKVPERYHQSVQNWVYDNGPLNKGEETFLELRDDFVTARRTPETKNLIEDFMEKCATKKPDSWLNWVLGAKEENVRPDGSKVVHLSTYNFDILSKLSAALLAVGFVLAPVCILFLANLGREKMAAVVGVFVLIFLFGASLVVELTAQEIFVFVVGYCAILVTLLSNFLQSSMPAGSPQ